MESEQIWRARNWNYMHASGTCVHADPASYLTTVLPCLMSAISEWIDKDAHSYSTKKAYMKRLLSTCGMPSSTEASVVPVDPPSGSSHLITCDFH